MYNTASTVNDIIYSARFPSGTARIQLRSTNCVNSHFAALIAYVRAPQCPCNEYWVLREPMHMVLHRAVHERQSRGLGRAAADRWATAHTRQVRCPLC